MGTWAVGMTREKGEMGNEEGDSMDQREGISTASLRHLDHDGRCSIRMIKM
jgi:hypothetical protein